ncbi:MAG TPA: galactose oxidase-like domain-containing protein [Gemmatimonadales bacterium]|nr:galactose oxidase-like domain-containing protein [Gemmatimonadales bacterium]
MPRSVRAIAGWTAIVFLLLPLIVLGCQDGGELATGPELATTAKKTLKVTGGGNGTGKVTAPAIGGAPSLSCSITAATYDPIDCTRSYAINTRVKLTAVPASGSKFKEWQGACSGTSLTCTVNMNVGRTVKAVFRTAAVASYRVNVSGAGTGNGTITSQAGLSPAITCTFTAGSGQSGACSQSYPSGTNVVLTASSASGHEFTGWSGDCTGTGSCSLTITANRAVAASFRSPAGPEAVFGRWSAPASTPVVGLHLNLLPNGQMLLWGHGGQPQLWTPGGGAGFIQAPDATCAGSNCELFCAGHTFLADGRLLVAGGHNEALGNNWGLTQASVFDAATSAWTAVAPMAYERWYPTLVTLADGDVVALSGNRAPDQNASIPERWNGSTWTQLTGANLALPLYPRAFVEPKQGRVFVAGDGKSHYLDPAGAGAWTAGPARTVGSRGYGSAVMIDSRVLYAGGGGGGCPGSPQATAEIIDLAAPSPTWTRTGSMAYPRRHNNLTILPDGKVLVTGGTSACGFTNESGAVFAAEMWDPATGQWTTLASAAVVRVYHSTSALLPDGRVLSTGSGDGGGASQQLNREVFSPPYLFRGPRPTYDLATTAMHYGQPFTITTPDAAAIAKVTIIRLPSTTHAFDMSQRLNTLAFAVGGDGQSLRIEAPAAGRIAPPGPYMLFILSQDGVPSVAQTIMLSP